MPNIGFPELIIILIIVVVIFGASRLPQLGKGLGEGIRNFKSSVREGREDGDEEKGSETARKKSA